MSPTQSAAVSTHLDFIQQVPLACWATSGARVVAANAAALRLFQVANMEALAGVAPAEGTLATPLLDGRPVQIATWRADDLLIHQAIPVDPPEDADWLQHCGHDDDLLRRGLMSSSADCVKVLDADARLLYMNPGGRQIMAVDDFSRIAGASWLEFWSGSDQRRAREAFEIAKQGGVGRFTGQCQRLNGELRWWDVVVSPMRDAQGRVERLLSVSRDVSEMKDAANLEIQRGRVFEALASGEDLTLILDRVCRAGRETGGFESLILTPADGRHAWRVRNAPSRPDLLGVEIEAPEPGAEVFTALTGAASVQVHRAVSPEGDPLGLLVALLDAPPSARLQHLLASTAALADLVLERAAVQRRLRMKRDRLALIESRSVIGLYQVSPAGYWIYANSRWTELTGLTPEQCRGEGWLAAVHPADRPRVTARWHEARAEDGAFDAEFRLNLPPEQPPRWVVLHEARTSDGGYVGTLSDITELRLAHEELADTAERFRTLANNISQFCWMADARGWIFWYNDRWYEYTGTTLEQMQGWGWRAVHHPEHVDRVVEKISRHWLSGEVWEDTFPLRSKSGEYRWFLSRAIPIRDARGEIVRWFGTNTDITAERELTGALEDRNTALERSNEELRRMAFIASHDLQEPVRMISTSAQLIQRAAGSLLDVKSRDYLAGIVQHSGRMSRLIQSLLSYAQASAERGDQRGPCDLEAIIEGVRRDLSALFEEHGASLVYGPLPRVHCLDLHLAQVFQNLFSNAIKYRRPGVPPVIRVDAKREMLMWRISVSDNGQGFAPEHAGRIFHFLERLHGREIDGSGIGLAICQTIVERHGGTIGAEGIPGQGATISFTLPAEDVKPAAC